MLNVTDKSAKVINQEEGYCKKLISETLVCVLPKRAHFCDFGKNFTNSIILSSYGCALMIKFILLYIAKQLHPGHIFTGYNFWKNFPKC